MSEPFVYKMVLSCSGPTKWGMPRCRSPPPALCGSGGGGRRDARRVIGYMVMMAYQKLIPGRD